jgi:hypothetical protein
MFLGVGAGAADIGGEDIGAMIGAQLSVTLSQRRCWLKTFQRPVAHGWFALVARLQGGNVVPINVAIVIDVGVVVGVAG